MVIQQRGPRPLNLDAQIVKSLNSFRFSNRGPCVHGWDVRSRDRLALSKCPVATSDKGSSMRL